MLIIARDNTVDDISHHDLIVSLTGESPETNFRPLRLHECAEPPAPIPWSRSHPTMCLSASNQHPSHGGARSACPSGKHDTDIIIEWK